MMMQSLNSPKTTLNFENQVSQDEHFAKRYSTDFGIPFHLLKRQRILDLNAIQEMRDNQCAVLGIEDMHHDFCEKKINDNLSSFLPQLPGYVDAPGTSSDSLYGLIEKPPIGGRELAPLSSSSLSSFRIMPGSVPDQFKFMNRPPEKRKKHKKHKSQEDIDMATGDVVDKKHKKKKKEDGDKKKKKKEKKKKKDKKVMDAVTIS